MNPEKRGCFTIKTYQSYLYTWCPDLEVHKRNMGSGGKKQKYCNATAHSQGQDWVCTYVYQTISSGHGQQRSAYVACDYVK